MLLRVKVVTSDFKKFYVTISCHGPLHLQIEYVFLYVRDKKVRYLSLQIINLN